MIHIALLWRENLSQQVRQLTLAPGRRERRAALTANCRKNGSIPSGTYLFQSRCESALIVANATLRRLAPRQKPE
jgi:hypothetical protein